MTPVTETRRPIEGGKNRSLKATWRAIHSIPTDHFPLILPGVHPIAAPFILRQLKRRGFSNCKVSTSTTGLMVQAHR